MIARSILALTVCTLAISPAMAEIAVGNGTYPDRERRLLIAQCEGLELMSRRSVAEDDPEIENESDPQSVFMLSQLPFTLRDCKDAGLV